MRLFTGIEANSDILGNLNKFRSTNATLIGIKWTKPESIHITTFFIGDKTEFEMEPLVQHIKNICETTAPFILTTKKIDFSPGQNPYMIWHYFNSNENFTALCNNLSNALTGKTNVRHEIIPHITIARLKKPAFYYKINPIDVSPVVLEINKLILWESAITAKSNKYKNLYEFDLKG